MSNCHYTRTINGDTITLRLYEGGRMVKEVAVTSDTTLIAQTAAQWQDEGATPGQTILMDEDGTPDAGGRARTGATS